MAAPVHRIVMPSRPVAAKTTCPDAPVLREQGSYAFAHWAMVLIAEGSGGFRQAGTRFEVEPGTLLCMPPGLVDIEFGTETSMAVISLEERGTDADEAWRPFPVPVLRRLDARATAVWTERFAIARRKVAAGQFGDDDLRELKYAFGECFWLDSGRTARRVVHATFGALHDDLSRIERLADLAGHLGYTRNHLSDLMHDATGASLGAWVHGMRMARARQALIRTDRPIAEIGAMVGLADAAYFSRAFRRYHGVPPQQWRIAHRPDDARRTSLVVDIEAIPTAVA